MPVRLIHQPHQFYDASLWKKWLRLDLIFSIHTFVSQPHGSARTLAAQFEAFLLGRRETPGLVGDHSAGGPPDPIPNSVVKPEHADGTARVTLWESRYRRPSFTKPLEANASGGFSF